jgi:hypothetical protein
MEKGASTALKPHWFQVIAAKAQRRITGARMWQVFGLDG